MVQTAFQELRDIVERSATVQASAVDLLRGLADKLAELAKHPSADEIRALSIDIRNHARELADAIALHDGEEKEIETVEPEEEKEEE